LIGSPVGKPFGGILVSLLAVAGGAHCEELRAGEAVLISESAREFCWVAYIYRMAGSRGSIN